MYLKKCLKPHTFFDYLHLFTYGKKASKAEEVQTQYS